MEVINLGYEEKLKIMNVDELLIEFDKFIGDPFNLSSQCLLCSFINTKNIKIKNYEAIAEAKLLLLYATKEMEKSNNSYFKLLPFAKMLQMNIMASYDNKNDIEDWIRDWKWKNGAKPLGH
jgi:hypothetical protein